MIETICKRESFGQHPKKKFWISARGGNFSAPPRNRENWKKHGKTSIFDPFCGLQGGVWVKWEKYRGVRDQLWGAKIFGAMTFFRKIIFRGGKRGTKKCEKRTFFGGPRVSEYP